MFRKNSSSVSQLIKIYNNILQNKDARKEALFTFCDVLKAFDRI
jgi:hypothetical protein